MVLEILRRVEARTEKHLHNELLWDIKRVAGKVQTLFRVAEAVAEEPDGTVCQVPYPRVTEATFRDLVTYIKASGRQYRIWYQYVLS
jgi:reverse gyrase